MMALGRASARPRGDTTAGDIETEHNPTCRLKRQATVGTRSDLCAKAADRVVGVECLLAAG